MTSALARKVFVGGNWKSNGSVKFVEQHINFLNGIKYDSSRCDVVIAPMSIHLSQAKSLLKNNIQLSAQNVSVKPEGAFTGEVSAKHLVDLGINWTLIGHSERRTLFGETDEVVGNKIKIAQDNQLKVIACLGETLQERKENRTIDVCFRQLQAIAKGVANWRNTVLAYEPIWAIGTGETASPEQAQEVHEKLRQWLKKELSPEVSKLVQIIYGGIYLIKIKALLLMILPKI
jgi:triosephosphate isomerase